MTYQNRINETSKLLPGQKVTYSGFSGSVIRLYIDGDCEGARMYEVHLASGPVCVCGSDLSRRMA